MQMQGVGSKRAGLPNEKRDKSMPSQPLYSHTSLLHVNESQPNLGINQPQTAIIESPPQSNRPNLFDPHKVVIDGIANCIRSKFELARPSWKKFLESTREMWFEKFKKEATGKDPFVSEFYFRTHRKKSDESWVNEKAEAIYAYLTELTQERMTEYAISIEAKLLQNERKKNKRMRKELHLLMKHVYNKSSSNDQRLSQQDNQAYEDESDDDSDGVNGSDNPDNVNESDFDPDAEEKGKRPAYKFYKIIVNAFVNYIEFNPKDQRLRLIIINVQSMPTLLIGRDKSCIGNFDDNFVVGHGGFNNVYKGYIDNDATIVVVKRLNPSSKLGVREFETEIHMLSKLRHLHLVSLIGYCDDNNEMILVYDYMAHGTLRDHLYKTDIEY
ncbi:hypothetical protein CQW23_15394 [Capsicum baccatum]|uniref:Protein kinase domain-containing protein n=1 Tax=Capsicum baccatum TaxID=33114 RepID=A0A2G2WLX6_CAPBA|nr:hypothetical protein CQW23_15394 [Capsicum baccatum]